jgi:hypothetical protein
MQWPINYWKCLLLKKCKFIDTTRKMKAAHKAAFLVLVISNR